MGLSREVIRLIQENRKLSGFDVSDRISIHYQTRNAELLAAIESHKTEISQEVLAVSFENSAIASAATATETELELVIWLQKSN